MPWLSDLVVTELTEGVGHGNATWQLDAPLIYQSAAQNKIITIPAGFQTDFCSVPRVPIFFLLDGDLGNKAGTLHDYLYSKQPDGTHLVTKDQADAMLKEALIDSGVGSIRAQEIYEGVHVFGQKYYDGTAEHLVASPNTAGIDQPQHQGQNND